MGRGRVKLTEVNPHLVCVLCRGYLIDATTITECLHSFCRSCIILYLERKSYCPICEVQIHKTKPYLNLKLDKTLQDIVYKLVPGLFHNEMRRRQEFYKNHPLHDRHLHPEARGIAIDRLIYSPDDSISLSLEYYDKQREREEWRSVGDTSTVATHGAEGKRYLLCPAVVTMAHLKKFLRSKYNLPETATVEVLYRRESLPDSYSLMDVAYIYTWKQNEPMRFYYRIHLLTKCIKGLPELKSIDHQAKRADVDKEEEEDENEEIEIQIENTTETCRNNANKLDLIKQLSHSERILDVTESKRRESIKDGNNFISVNDRQINTVSKGLKSSLQTTKNNPHGNNLFQPFRNGDAQQQSILKKSITLKDSTDKNTTISKENISFVDAHQTTRPVSAENKNNSSHCTETTDVKARDLESSKDLNVKTETVCSNNVNVSLLKKETESHLKTVTVQNTVIEKKPVSGNSLLRKETELQAIVNETKNNKISNRTAVNNSRTSYHSLSFMTADLMKPTNPSPKCALLPNVKISEDIGLNSLCARDNSVSKTPEVPSKITAQRVNNQKNPPNGENLSKTTTAADSNTKKNLCMNSSCAKGIDSLAAKLGAKNSNHDANFSNKIPSADNSVLESTVLQNSHSAVSKQRNVVSDDNKPKESTNCNSLEKNGPESETDSKSKFLLKDNATKNNVTSKESHTSHIGSSENDISSSKNPEGDSENTVHLDESSVALLSAIGLKPKPKTHVKLDESTIETKSISEESCEKHFDELDKNKSGIPMPGLGPSRPFRSEHDEISVSLLLGLSNGHTEKKSENLQSTTNEQVKKNEDRPATQFQQLDDPLKNNQTKLLLTAATSPITNIQKVVNNIIPPAKKLPSKTIITHLSQEKKTDFEIKNTSDNFNQPVQINGFKVPLSPAPSDSRTTFNGSRLCPSPRPKSTKQNSNVGCKIGKVYDEKELSTNSSKNISESYITNNSYRGSFKLGSRSPVPQSIRIPSPRHISVADRMLKSTKYMSPLGITSLINNRDNSKTILANNLITKIENSKNIKRNGDVTSSQGKSESSSKTELKTEQQKVETAGKELQSTDKLNNESLTTSKPELKSSSSEPTAEVDASDSKVSLLKRKLNTQQNECDVVVSTATRDDSLTEAKKRRQVTPDVSIELLSGPLNERNSIKRPLFEYPSLTKKLSTEKSSTNTVENNHTELRISSIDQLCASSVKIEKIPSSQLNNNSVRNTVKDRHTAVSDGKTIEHLRPSSTKTDSNESKNNTNDDLSAPDITIEKMRESPKLVQKKIDSDCEIKVTKVAEVSATKLNNLPSTKRQSESPSSSLIIDSDSPLNPKKMPRLIEINAPPRPKLDPTFQERKHQKTGLKMTTVRKEVPIGKEVPLVRKDCNGPLDLSGKGTTTTTKQSVSSTTLSSTSTSSPKPPQQYSPSAVALQQFVRQHLELQFASHANNNLGLDWRKDLFTTKHLEDWVRNAISCGALPPHPFMFNPAATPPSPHRK